MDRKEELAQFLESIGDSLIIVEGKRDLDALVYVGIEETQIIELNKGVQLELIVEALSALDEVIILTDMDRKGKDLRAKLISLFAAYGVNEKRRSRELFTRLHLSHVEGLKREG